MIPSLTKAKSYMSTDGEEALDTSLSNSGLWGFPQDTDDSLLAADQVSTRLWSHQLRAYVIDLGDHPNNYAGPLHP